MGLFYTNVREANDKLMFIGYQDGKRITKIVDYKPEFYIRASDVANSTHVDIFGNPLSVKKFNDIRQAKKYIYNNKDVGNFQLYGSTNYAGQFIARVFGGEIEYNLDYIRRFYIDIETWAKDEYANVETANLPITLITIYDSYTKKKYTWGTKPFSLTLPDHEYYEFTIEREKEMLTHLVTWWKCNYPDVISGWNSSLYDNKYLINRMTRLLGDNVTCGLSPWGSINTRKIQNKRFGKIKEEEIYDIHGIADLDYMDLYKKYYPSGEAQYSLDYISNKHLKRNKVKYKGSLHELYERDYDTYVLYNVEDVQLVVDLDEKLKYIPLIIEVAYAGFVPSYMDALGTTRFWETLIYHHLYQQKIIPPIKGQSGEKTEKYDGGYVKDPIPNMYEWIVSFDVTSLYPSIIRTLNIGAETKMSQRLNITVDDLLNKLVDNSYALSNNYSLSGNGNYYSRDKKSFFAELMEKLFNKRKYYNGLKKTAETPDLEKIYDIKQYALKILINSFYGATGTQYFQFFDLDNAKSVTLTGQYIIKSIANALNTYLNGLLETVDVDYIVGVDTDSNYVHLDAVVKKYLPPDTPKEKIRQFLDKFSEQHLQKVIDNAIHDCLSYVNVFENHISMKREVICDKVVWVKPKHYAMSVLDKEGKVYTDTEIVAKGIALVKSSTPDFCREHLREALKIILTGDNDKLIKYIFDFKKKFMLATPDQIAFPRSVNGLVTYGKTTYKVPIQVSAAKNFNRLIRKYGLENKYPKIMDGGKLKFVYLKEPNHVFSSVIGFTDEIPSEFGLEDFVDYHTMFEKTFLVPLKSITDIVGWELSKKKRLF
jgi:DNA polymerase elongation subunit (family B)